MACSWAGAGTKRVKKSAAKVEGSEDMELRTAMRLDSLETRFGRLEGYAWRSVDLLSRAVDILGRIEARQAGMEDSEEETAEERRERKGKGKADPEEDSELEEEGDGGGEGNEDEE